MMRSVELVTQQQTPEEQDVLVELHGLRQEASYLMANTSSFWSPS